jgi:hypothetical protein
MKKETSMKRELLCTLVLGGLLAGSAVAAPQVIDVENGDILQQKLEWQAAGGHFPPSGQNVSRDGGNDAGSATPVQFTNGCFSEIGSTVGKGDNIQGSYYPLHCYNSGAYYPGVTGYSEDAWYSFSIPSQSIVTLSTVSASTLYDTAVFIVAADGTTILAGDDDYAGSPSWQSQISCNLLAGTYYAVIDGYGTSEVGQYAMSLCYTGCLCPANAYTHDEGQDGCGMYGNIIDCGVFYCGTISAPTDSDTYTCISHPAVNPSRNNLLRLTVDGQGFGLDGTITVYDELCGTVLAQLVGNGDGLTMLEFCLTPDTPFVVEVTGAAGTTGDYSVRLQCLCCPNANDSTINNPTVVTSSSNWMGGAVLDLSSGCATGMCAQFGRTSYQWVSIYVPNDPCVDTVVRYCGGGDCAASPVWLHAGLGNFWWCPSCIGNGAWCAGPVFYAGGWSEAADANGVLLMQVVCCPGSTLEVEYVDLCPQVAADELPSTFTLEQNYPNPFNPTTSISFSLPETGTASLRVFDMTGREVATLVNGMTERGTHTVSFDASNLGTGVYFYTLQSGSFTTTKKMVLVK